MSLQVLLRPKDLAAWQTEIPVKSPPLVFKTTTEVAGGNVVTEARRPRSVGELFGNCTLLEWCKNTPTAMRQLRGMSMPQLRV